jgi:acyl-CoA reductase-like NAD-dependent aldehyde dehydrogenase
MSTFQTIFDAQKACFASGVTRTYAWRVEQLDRMAGLLVENEAALQRAIAADFKTARVHAFGGTGPSGMGHYYGKHGFDALTHAKSMFMAPPDRAIGHLFPPYTTPRTKSSSNGWTTDRPSYSSPGFARRHHEQQP